MRVCVLYDDETYGFTPAEFLKHYPCEWEMITFSRPVREKIRALAEENRFDVYFNLCDGASDEDYPGLDVVEAMEKDSGIRLAELKVDGGMVYDELLMQFQADILGVPVVRPQVAETTALGAAYAAGLAVGFWDNLEDLRANWQVDKTWTPQLDNRKKESLYSGWLKAVERTFNWVE